jgi:hypothetical protein
MAGLQADLAKTRQDLDNEQSERTRIAYVTLFVSVTMLNIHIGPSSGKRTRNSQRSSRSSCKLVWTGTSLRRRQS